MFKCAFIIFFMTGFESYSADITSNLPPVQNSIDGPSVLDRINESAGMSRETANTLMGPAGSRSLVNTTITETESGAVQPDTLCCDNPAPGTENRAISVLADQFAMRSCACLLKDVPSSPIAAVEAANLKRVCDCYSNQAAINPNAQNFVDLLTTSKCSIINEVNTEALNNLQRNISYISRGTLIHASLMNDNSAAGNNLLSLYQTRGNQVDVNSTINAVLKGHDATCDRNVLGSISIPEQTSRINRELNSSGSEIISGSVIPTSAEQCLPFRHYLSLKQVDHNDELYRDIGAIDLSAIDPAQESPILNEWNLTLIKVRLESLYTDSPSSPEIDKLENRLKFLLANPMYANLLSSRSQVAANRSLQIDLLKQIQKNFSPVGCPSSGLFSACMAARLSRIRAEDSQFFNQDLVKELTLPSKDDILSSLVDPVMTSLSGAATTLKRVLSSPNGASRFTVRDNDPAALVVLSNRSFNHLAAEQCASAESILLQPPEISNSVSKLRLGKLINESLKKLDPDPSKNAEYKNLSETLCNTKRCINIEGPLQLVSYTCPAETFSEYLTRKRENCSTSRTPETCWNQNLAEFLSSHSGIKPTDPFNLPQDNISTNLVSAYFNRGATATFSSNQEPASVERILTIAPVDPAVPPVRYVRNGVPVSAQERTEVSRRQDTLIRSVENSSSAIADRTSVTRTDGGRNVTAVERSFVPVDGIPASLLSTYDLTPGQPIPPQAISSITNDLQSARRELQNSDVELNRLASNITDAKSSEDKSKYEAQLRDLTNRAEVRNQRITDLETLLRQVQNESSRVRRRPASDIEDQDSPDTLSRNAGGSTLVNTTGSQNAVVQNINPGLPLTNFGSGPSSATVPVTLPRVPGRQRSGALNLNFKYGTDAKVRAGGPSSPGLIVAGESSAFEATGELAEVVNSSRSLDIGAVSAAEATLIINRDPTTLSKYASTLMQTPGTIVRLVFTSPDSSQRELIVGKTSDGNLFFPQVRNLGIRRLEQMRALLGSTNSSAN